ncbi:MAG TPA: formyltransferase family protein [Gaiellaceae bacterium]|nr:formyltransferase family protein [Gaiellaceae bacterium]
MLAIAPERSAPWHSSLQEAARQAGVPCLTPDDVNDEAVLARVAEHEAELLLSVYYTQVFAPRLLEAVDGPAVNLHPSLLPRHRGVAPIVWAIAEGDRVTGLTAHHIDEGIDTGPVIVQRPLPIHPEDTGYRLHLKMAGLVRATAADLLRPFLGGEGIPPGLPQTGVSTYHSRRDPQLNRLDWSSPRERIRDIVRALAPPLPGAFMLLNGEALVIARVELVPHEETRRELRPGMVELGRDGVPLVWAADGPLKLTAFVDGGEIVPGRDLSERRALLSGQVLG